MRPEWLRCATCLWWPNGCEALSINRSRGLCNEWTCEVCWKKWDIMEYEDGPLAEESWFLDHSCCTPARVGRGEVSTEGGGVE